MLANALFADGSAALLVEAQPRKGINLKPIAFHCDLATEGEQDMAWTIGDWGFEMKTFYLCTGGDSKWNKKTNRIIA